MGGLAFVSGSNPLSTPRMPLAVYEAVKSACHEILKRYYKHVATPIEGPAKKDFGDVDFLVACPTQLGRGSNIAVTLCEALGTPHSISRKGSTTVNFALPWPNNVEGESTASGRGPEEVNADQDRFVQVDVHVCEGQEEWEWELFNHAHGDLWSILRSTISKQGLTVNNVGLYLRISEIKLRGKDMVLLTKDPTDVLNFLSLDEGRWWQRFESPQALYEYAATCRYFRVEEEKEKEVEEKKSLRHDDRKRLNRPLFRKWVEEFVPQCRASGAYSRQALSREQVLADAFERFGVKEEYDRRLLAWRRGRQEEEVWRDVIKAGLPTEDVAFDLRVAAIRGLKGIIIEGDLSHGVVPPKPLKTADGFYDTEAVGEFVRDNWHIAGAIQLEKQNVRVARPVETS